MLALLKCENALAEISVMVIAIVFQHGFDRSRQSPEASRPQNK
jgi:hypothetical protein